MNEWIKEEKKSFDPKSNKYFNDEPYNALYIKEGIVVFEKIVRLRLSHLSIKLYRSFFENWLSIRIAFPFSRFYFTFRTKSHVRIRLFALWTSFSFSILFRWRNKKRKKTKRESFVDEKRFKNYYTNKWIIVELKRGKPFVDIYIYI